MLEPKRLRRIESQYKDKYTQNTCCFKDIPGFPAGVHRAWAGTPWFWLWGGTRVVGGWWVGGGGMGQAGPCWLSPVSPGLGRWGGGGCGGQGQAGPFWFQPVSVLEWWGGCGCGGPGPGRTLLVSARLAQARVGTGVVGGWEGGGA